MAATLVASGAGCSGMSVSSDYNPMKVGDMKTYKTYAWLKTPEGRKRSADQFIDQRIRMVADRKLADKGYQKSESSPDFLIGWHALLDKKLSYSTVNSYYGYGWGYYGGVGASRTYVTEYHEGTLLLDVVDALSDELVWRGIAQAEVYPNADADYRNRQIESAVGKILSQFPPDK
jgi:hypothetical protein